jgi:hypothetical protein
MPFASKFRVARRGLVVAVLFGAAFASGGHRDRVNAQVSCPALVISGDHPNATGDFWGFHEGYYSQLRSLLTLPANFGPTGTVKSTFTEGLPVGTASGIPDAAAFAGRNVFVSGATYITTAGLPDRSNYTEAEKTLIRNFVLGGGAAVLNTNRIGFADAAAMFGFVTRATHAYYEPITAPLPGAPGYVAFRAPSDATMVAGSPMQTGPFGSISGAGPGMFHTVTAFTSVPAAWLVGATLNVSGQANGDNNFDNLPVIAYMRAGGLGAGSGPVVVTSDLDLFSNAYDGLTNAAPDANNLMLAANRTLTLNTFAWLANQMCGLGTRSAVVTSPGGGTPRTTAVPVAPVVLPGRSPAVALRPPL